MRANFFVAMSVFPPKVCIPETFVPLITGTAHYLIAVVSVCPTRIATTIAMSITITAITVTLITNMTIIATF